MRAGGFSRSGQQPCSDLWESSEKRVCEMIALASQHSLWTVKKLLREVRPTSSIKRRAADE